MTKLNDVDAIAIPFKKSKDNFDLIHQMTVELFPVSIPYVQYMLEKNNTIVAVAPAPCPMPTGYDEQVASIVASGGHFNTWVDPNDNSVHISVGQYPDNAIAEQIIAFDLHELDDFVLGTKIREIHERLINDAYLAINSAKH